MAFIARHLCYHDSYPALSLIGRLMTHMDAESLDLAHILQGARISVEANIKSK